MIGRLKKATMHLMVFGMVSTLALGMVDVLVKCDSVWWSIYWNETALWFGNAWNVNIGVGSVPSKQSLCNAVKELQ